MPDPRPVAAIVYLDVDDEITSAATRIRMSQERRLALVLPAGSRVSTSRINFRLLSREASSRGRDLAIVTPEASTRALAASAGLPVFASVAEYEDALEDTGSDPPAPTGGAEADATMAPEAAADGVRDDGDRGPTAPGTVADAATAGQLTGWWARDAADATPRPSRASIGGPHAAGGLGPGVRAGSTARSASSSGGYPTPAGLRPRTSVTDTVVLPIPDVRDERPRRRISGWVLALTSVLIVLIVAGTVAAWQLLPSAIVIVAARAHSVGPLQFTVRADPLAVTANVANGVVPAQVVTFDLRVSQDFPASGKKVSETKATGAIEWTNCDPTRSYTIPAGTVLRTGTGTQFLTGDGVFLPVAILSGNPPTISCQSRDVAITARAAGDGGNVDAGTITVVPSDYNSVVIRASNPNPTTGGTHVESRIVAQKDVDGALTALGKALGDEFTAQLADPARVPAGLTLFQATRSMSAGDPTVLPDSLVGQVVPSFTLGLVATATATAVDPRLVLALGDQRIRAAVAPDRSLVKGSVDVRLGTPRVDGSAVLFPVTAWAAEIGAPDPAAIRRIVKGLSADEARQRLRDYGDATVDVWPGWVTTITSYDFRLDIRVVSDVATEPTTPEPSTLQPVAPSSPRLSASPSTAPDAASGSPSAGPSTAPQTSPSAGEKPSTKPRPGVSSSAAPSST